MLTLALRVLFILLAFGLAWAVRMLDRFGGPDAIPAYFPFLAAGLAVGIVVLEKVFQKRHLRVAVAGFIGLILGVCVTLAFVVLLLLLLPPAEPGSVTVKRTLAEEFSLRLSEVSPFIPVIALLVCYLTIMIVLQTRDQFRFILPYVDLSHQGRPGGGLLLDTSALIDGRIVELAAAGLCETPLVVPAFVVRELQAVADSPEKAKRVRGQRGLEMLKSLRERLGHEVKLLDVEMEHVAEVDDKLVQLARGLDAKLVTADGNLARVARINSVVVIHLHELMSRLRPPAITGDVLGLRVVKPGEGPEQGVGFLEDGTMVVIDGARDLIGTTVDVVVRSTLQTTAGRMVFARLKREGESSAARPAVLLTPPEGSPRQTTPAGGTPSARQNTPAGGTPRPGGQG